MKMCQKSKKYNKNSISICVWNARGLKTSIPYIRELCKRYDLVLITEHWLHSNRLDELDGIAENVSYFGRASRHSGDEAYWVRRWQGGVAILWNKNIISITPMHDYVHDRFCAVRIQNDNSAVFNIFCVYLPARGCSDDLTTTLDELCAVIENTEVGTRNIICGDMNADVGDMCGTRNTNKCTKEGTMLYNFITKYDLLAANLGVKSKGPVDTFYGPLGTSCIDYILIPNDMSKYILECRTLEYEGLNGSDHLPVVCKVNIGAIECATLKMNFKKKLRWDKLSMDDLFIKCTTPVDKNFKDIFNFWKGKSFTKADIDDVMETISEGR